MNNITFMKMHGLGNDFVVFDAREEAINLNRDMVCTIANRRTGIGCDQVIIIEQTRSRVADIFMRIYNADGGEVETCGNATRCVADMLMTEKNSDQSTIETTSGLLKATRASNGVTVNMGRALLEWSEIPLANKTDTLHVALSEGILSDPVCVNVGNPHIVYFVDKLENIPLDILGPRIEHNDLFPQRTNVDVVKVINKNNLKIRVWERGAGITQACGSGACAALVAGCRRGLNERQARVEVDGGVLEIEWKEDGCVLMTGPTTITFTGSWPL